MCAQKKLDPTRLPRPLQTLVAGLKAGSGTTSPRSHLMNVGGRPDLIPIVFSITPGGGLTRFLTTLGTLSALKEERSGERILMLSWGLEREDLRSLLQTSVDDGGAGEIAFDLSIPAEVPNGTSPSISPRPQTSGISGVPCDVCGQPIRSGDPYASWVIPPDDMSLYHPHCLRGRMNAD